MAETTNLNQLKGDTKIPLNILLKRVWKYLKPEMGWFTLALLLILLNVAGSIAMPLLTEGWTNQLQLESPSLEFVILSAVMYFLTCFFSQIFLYFDSWILHWSGQRIIYNLRMEVFEHISNMSQNQFNDMPVGSLVTRVTNYTTSLSNLFTHTIAHLIRDVVTIAIVYVVLLIKSPILTGYISIFAVVIFIASFIFSKIIKSLFKKERAYVSDLNTFLSENLSGMKITQLFNQQKRKDKEFLEKNNILTSTRFKIDIAFGVYRPFATFLHYGAIALTFYLAFDIHLDSGELFAIYQLLGQFFTPIEKLADEVNNIAKAHTACERLFNLLDVEPEVLDVENAIEVDKFVGEIEFRNVWFAYQDEDWILKDVSFHILPKQTVAFVGATGAGKTTILSLIVRNYEIQKGEILIDGISIKNIKISSLRKAVGQMLQDVFLFSGSLRNNISIYDETYSDSEIMETCKYVNADTIINNVPDGLDEQLIERGENLSQGQRQLISFARTVLHKPQILILDEATANIDTETESLIQDSLENMKSIGTMLVVAHRLSTIQKADQIIVLSHGEVIESGTHQKLLKNRGYYYKLYLLQFADKH